MLKVGVTPLLMIISIQILLILTAITIYHKKFNPKTNEPTRSTTITAQRDRIEKELHNLYKKQNRIKEKRLPRFNSSIPWVYAITPTYQRLPQKADLVRLSQTLMHVDNLHWIVVEDHSSQTNLVSNLLNSSGLSFTHLNTPTPPDMKRLRKNRGSLQRNLGLEWIRKNVDISKTPGVVYFMDDDNTYHIKLFEEMRWAHNVAVWPVGLVGGLRYEGPTKCKDGKVLKYNVQYAPERDFPFDMAAFAINLNIIIKEKPKALFDPNGEMGYLEPIFLRQVTTKDKLEATANNCTQVLVWHTKTDYQHEIPFIEKKLGSKGSDPNVETR